MGRTGRERQERRALGAASPQPKSSVPQSILEWVTVTRRSFPWREVGWDFAGVRERPRDGHFMAGGQERERGDGSADVEKSRRTQE
jgi:hypothetical protein